MRALAMRALLLVLLLVGGCGGSDSVCSKACDKVHQCGLRVIHITSVNTYTFGDDCGAVSCDKVSACVAGCIQGASCGELQAVVPNGPFHSCLIGCNSWFRIPDAGG